MGEEDSVQRFKAVQMMLPVNEYIRSLGVEEIVYPSIEQVPGTRSFLMVYSPLFKELTWTWLISRLLLLVAAVYGIVKLAIWLF